MAELEIVTKPKLTPEEKTSLFGWGDDLWANDKYGLTWVGTDIHVVGSVGGTAVTQAGAYLHTVTHNGSELRLGGLNGVITIPEARGKGYGNRVVSGAEQHIRVEMDADFGMLFCHPELVPFYEPRGWEIIDGPVTNDQPDGPRLTPHIVMVLPFKDATWSDGPFNLSSYPW